MSRFFRTITIMTFLGSGLMSCTSDNEEDLFPPVTGGNEVSLSTDVQPIIENNCAVTGCHVAGVQSPNFQESGNIISNAARIRVRAVVLRTMPPSSKPDLSSEEIDTLKDWIDQGALDN